MKKSILVLALFGALFFTTNTVSAKGVIVYSNGEKIEVSRELPDSITVNNEHVNLGVMYEQFSIFWIPMWNYGETKYVLINDREDTYYDLDEDEIEMLRTEFSIDIPEKPTIGFWNKIGGKLIWIAVIALILFGWRSKNDDNDDEVEAPQQEEAEQQ